MNRALLASLAAACLPGGGASAALAPGEIALVGFNADGDDSVAFVALTAIPALEVIYFTDNQWNGLPAGAGGAFTSDEGGFAWISPLGGLPAGTVVRLITINSIPRDLDNHGSIGDRFGSCDLADSNEAVIAYQGPDAANPTVLLAALGNSTVANTGNDLAGSGLTAGTGNAVFLAGDDDVLAYTGPRTGQPTLAAYLPLLADPANWITDDGEGDQSTGGNPPDIPFSNTPFQTGGTVQGLTLEFDQTTVAETAGTAAIIGTVTRSGSPLGDLEVFVSISDSSEATALGIVTIPNGQASATFDVDIVDDAWPDGSQTVAITAAAIGLTPHTAQITVTDAGLDAFTLVINEVYYAVNSSLLDANGDGTADTTSPASTDEFIEIVNVSPHSLQLDDLQLRSSSRGTLHTFPQGTLLESGQALVVFGGGNLDQGTRADAFGTAEIQFANGAGTGGLGLEDTGDSVSLLSDIEGEGEYHGVLLPDQSALPTAGSLTLATDANPTSGYIPHTVAGPAPFSPGCKTDGSPFLVTSTPLSLTIDLPSVPEDGPPVNATVSLPNPATRDVIVHLEPSDPAQLQAASPALIGAGESSASVTLTPQDDALPDGTQTITVRARASGCLNAAATIDVTDNEPTPGYLAWAAANGIPGQPPDADSDHDGLDNLLEYALGLTPAIPNPPPAALDGLVLRFTKGPAAAFSGDVTWTIETSPTLNPPSWSPVTPTVDNPTTISFTLPLGHPTLFARLKVSQPPP